MQTRFPAPDTKWMCFRPIANGILSWYPDAPPRRMPRGVAALCLILLSGLNACSLVAPPESVPASEITHAVTPASEPLPLLLSTPPNGLTAEILYDLLVANIGFQREQHGIATEALARAARSAQDIKLLSEAARTALHYDNHTLAAELGELWVDREPENEAAYLVTALAYLGAGADTSSDTQSNQTAPVSTDTPAHLERAFQIINQFVRRDSDNPDVAFQKLLSVLNRHNIDASLLEVSTRLVARFPQNQDAWLMQATLANKYDDRHALEEALNRLQALNPAHEAAAQYRLALIETDAAGDNPVASQEQAISYAESYLAQHPAAANFRQQYARMLLRFERDAEAIVVFRAILAEEADHKEAMSALGALHFDHKDYDKAIPYLERLIELDPHDDRSRVYLGISLHELERYDAAIATLERVREDSFRFMAQRNIMLVIEDKAGIDAALSYHAELYPSDEEETTQWVLDHTELLRRAKRLNEARSIIDEGVEKYPDNRRLRYGRAMLLVEIKDLPAHELDMRWLLEADPENADYLNTLGYTILELSDNRLVEARTLIEKAMALNPDSAYITDSMGWVEFKSGNHQAAIRWLEAAYELDQDAEIAAHLGEVYWVIGDKQRAQKIWAEGKQHDPENSALRETLKRLAP